MRLALMIGIPATGKSSFASMRFKDRVYINRDSQRSHSEMNRFRSALAQHLPVVVDNTNVTRAERERFVAPAREAGYEIEGYFFRSLIREARARNATRDNPVPDVAIYARSRLLELPSLEEGFDSLWFVEITDDGFKVDPWEEPDAGAR